MTPKEMLLMRLDGATYQEIADACGISRQAAHAVIKRYVVKCTSKRRGRDFYCDSIKYKGIYEHFLEDEKETVSSFAKAVFGYEGKGRETMGNFLTGKSNSHFTISQIKRMCEICGKSFEEVFEERL